MSYNVKYFKEIKSLKGLQKAVTYLETRLGSTMELFREYTQRHIIFATKAPSLMFDRVTYRPLKILEFSK